MPPKSDADSIVTADADDCDDCQIENEPESCTTFDSNVFANDNNNDDIEMNDMSISSKDVTPVPSPCVEIQDHNDLFVDEYPDSELVVTEINKLCGLGISIEGTVEVEGGIEKRPHHFIRSILNDGPVAIDGKLKPGDELLQVNEHKLLGLTHTEVVKILKELPTNVRVVCARGHAPSIINTSQNLEAFESRSIVPSGHLILQGSDIASKTQFEIIKPIFHIVFFLFYFVFIKGLLKAQSESSLFTSSTNTITDQHRSKSMEQVSGLALWSSETVYIDIEKTERGFGFSILDYQDPLDQDQVLIVVR